jgi:acyl-CoA reductase-like NAD-dependent aldehyde dehydrogenase
MTTPTLTTYELPIGGAWSPAAGGATFEAIDPFDAEPWALAPEATAEDVDRAVAAARAAVDGGPWATMTGAERARLMRRLAEILAEDADELA